MDAPKRQALMMKGYSKKGECGSELVSRQIEKQEDNGSKFTSPRAEGKKNNFNMVNIPSRLATFTKLNWIVCVPAIPIFIPLPFINWS